MFGRVKKPETVAVESAEVVASVDAVEGANAATDVDLSLIEAAAVDAEEAELLALARDVTPTELAAMYLQNGLSGVEIGRRVKKFRATWSIDVFSHGVLVRDYQA